MKPWAIAIGGVLAYDTWLLRQGRDPLSTIARKHPNATIVGVGLFLLHIFGGERFDPLTHAARYIGTVRREA